MARMARVVVPYYPHHVTRTGSPLDCAGFVRKLEVITGKELAPKKPGRKPVIKK